MDIFTFYCKGHQNVRATHESTLEFTKDDNLSLKGDCIIGVNSTESLKSFPNKLKEKIRNPAVKICVKIQVENYVDIIKGYGDSKLELTDENAIIIRRSDFMCSRTLMINSDKAANDISRQLIQKMKNPDSEMKVTVMIKEK